MRLTSLKHVSIVNKSWKIFKSIWFAFQECAEMPNSCCDAASCTIKPGNNCDMGLCCENCKVRVFLNFYITYISKVFILYDIYMFIFCFIQYHVPYTISLYQKERNAGLPMMNVT